MFTTRKREAFAARRSERCSQIGRAMEEEVYQILLKAKEQGVFSSVVHHPQNTPAVDFTVEKVVDGRPESRSFGMTTSIRVWNARKNSPQTQFCFPVGVKPETVVKRVSGLFEK